MATFSTSQRVQQIGVSEQVYPVPFPSGFFVREGDDCVETKLSTGQRLFTFNHVDGTATRIVLSASQYQTSSRKQSEQPNKRGTMWLGTFYPSGLSSSGKVSSQSMKGDKVSQNLFGFGFSGGTDLEGRKRGNARRRASPQQVEEAKRALQSYLLPLAKASEGASTSAQSTPRSSTANVSGRTTSSTAPDANSPLETTSSGGSGPSPRGASYRSPIDSGSASAAGTGRGRPSLGETISASIKSLVKPHKSPSSRKQPQESAAHADIVEDDEDAFDLFGISSQPQEGQDTNLKSPPTTAPLESSSSAGSSNESVAKALSLQKSVLPPSSTSAAVALRTSPMNAERPVTPARSPSNRAVSIRQLEHPPSQPQPPSMGQNAKAIELASFQSSTETNTQSSPTLEPENVGLDSSSSGLVSRSSLRIQKVASSADRTHITSGSGRVAARAAIFSLPSPPPPPPPYLKGTKSSSSQTLGRQGSSSSSNGKLSPYFVPPPPPAQSPRKGGQVLGIGSKYSDNTLPAPSPVCSSSNNLKQPAPAYSVATPNAKLVSSPVTTNEAKSFFQISPIKTQQIQGRVENAWQSSSVYSKTDSGGSDSQNAGIERSSNPWQQASIYDLGSRGVQGSPKSRGSTISPARQARAERPSNIGFSSYPDRSSSQQVMTAPSTNGGERSELFTYEQLINGSLPAHINTAEKEMYMTDVDFKKVVGMDKEQFRTLPRWKQQNLKKSLNLF